MTTAASIAAQTGDLYLCIAPILKCLQHHLGNPCLTQLTPCVARRLSDARLDAYIDSLPLHQRAPTRALIDLHTAFLSDETRGMYVPKKIPWKTTNGRKRRAVSLQPHPRLLGDYPRPPRAGTHGPPDVKEKLASGPQLSTA